MRVAKKGISSMKARVYVSYKDTVLDPQGKTVRNALKSLGYDDVLDVRQGKYFQIEMKDIPKEQAEKMLKEMADKILSNPVIEKFEIEI
jgi:phosphoribosylformylglycinamidine synthase PurS subunit